MQRPTRIGARDNLRTPSCLATIHARNAHHTRARLFLHAQRTYLLAPVLSCFFAIVQTSAAEDANVTRFETESKHATRSDCAVLEIEYERVLVAILCAASCRLELRERLNKRTNADHDADLVRIRTPAVVHGALRSSRRNGELEQQQSE